LRRDGLRRTRGMAASQFGDPEVCGVDRAGRFSTGDTTSRARSDPRVAGPPMAHAGRPAQRAFGPTDSAAGFQPGYIARIRRYRAMSGHALTMA
jgi:hypothetical protein